MEQMHISPTKLIRLCDAPRYLGIDKSAFNEFVRPFIQEIRLGKRRVFFDYLDLDQWIERHKTFDSIELGDIPSSRTNKTQYLHRYGATPRSSSCDEFTQTVRQILTKQLK